jgi:hypothetical protein
MHRAPLFVARLLKATARAPVKRGSHDATIRLQTSCGESRLSDHLQLGFLAFMFPSSDLPIVKRDGCQRVTQISLFFLLLGSILFVTTPCPAQSVRLTLMKSCGLTPIW